MQYYTKDFIRLIASYINIITLFFLFWCNASGNLGIKNVYKIVVIYSITSRQPIAYAILPGNIPDGKTVPNALEQLKALKLNA